MAEILISYSRNHIARNIFDIACELDIFHVKCINLNV